MNQKILYLVFLFLPLVFGRKGFGPTDQEWGFVEVRDKANMFWWLHYTRADKDPLTRPLVIWVQGGPGASSSGYGNFLEIGPLDVDLNERNITWVDHVNLLLVDNPVGCGFSYLSEGGEYTTNKTQIAEDFFVLLKAFYEKLPDMKKVPLYMFGESYGGKMVVDIALRLHQEIQKGNLDITLKGIGLGDSWIAPMVLTNNYGAYLYNMGFIDENGYRIINASIKDVQDAISAGEYVKASEKWSYIQYVIYKVTEGMDLYNVLTKTTGRNRVGNKYKSGSYIDSEALINIMNNDVKQALNISEEISWIMYNSSVNNALRNDDMQPVTEIVEELLNTTDIRVVIYNGQLDVIVNSVGTLQWMSSLKWQGASQWQNSYRNSFIIDGFIEGYVKQQGNLFLYSVNRAGHMVPIDNPAAMEHILKETTDNYKV